MEFGHAKMECVTAFGKRETERYSRQMLVPEIGVEGHGRLAGCSVLIIGCGGLGSPAALYLAGAGVGRLGLMDADQVESSNLHRQIMHTEARVGCNKAESGAEACGKLNSLVPVEVYRHFLLAHNAVDTIKDWDIVIDASDNVTTRYLANDACVLLGKPLVYGSALRLEGQLTVFNYEGGPCYRCMFPTPPPLETVTDCSDGGVAGPVPGVIGTLQAMEAIKVACKRPSNEVMSGRMLLYSAAACSFRNIRLRTRRADCAICGDAARAQREGCDLRAQVREEPNTRGPASACQALPHDSLSASHRATCAEYAAARQERRRVLLLDVRDGTQFSMCHLPEALNVPLMELKAMGGGLRVENASLLAQAEEIFVVCRRGIYSQEATTTLLQLAQEGQFARCEALKQGKIRHIEGGLSRWAACIDPDFPVY